MNPQVILVTQPFPNGPLRESLTETVTVSAGATNSQQVVVTNSLGLIDPSLLPAGGGALSAPTGLALVSTTLESDPRLASFLISLSDPAVPSWYAGNPSAFLTGYQFSINWSQGGSVSTRTLTEPWVSTGQYSITGTPAGAAVSVTASAVDYLQQAGAKSAILSFTDALSTALPSAPVITGVAANPDTGAIITIATPNTEEDFDHYALYRGNGTSASTAVYSQVYSPYYGQAIQDNNIPYTEENYYYYVKAVTLSGVTSSSNIVGPLSLTGNVPAIPAVPVLVAADLTANANGSITLTFPGNTDGITYGYLVYRQDPATSAWEQLQQVVPTASGPVTFTDLNAVNGILYTYAVAAINATGGQSALSATVSITSTETILPRAPVISSTPITGSPGEVQLTWDPVNVSDLVGYLVSFNSAADPAVFTSDQVQGTTFTLYGLTSTVDQLAGTLQFQVATMVQAPGVATSLVSNPPASYTVQFADLLGYSPSNGTFPTAPSPLTATANADDSITVTFAAPTQTGIAGYQIERLSNENQITGQGNAGYTWNILTTLKDSTPGTKSYRDAGLEPYNYRGMQYLYAVRSIDTMGNISATNLLLNPGFDWGNFQAWQSITSGGASASLATSPSTYAGSAAAALLSGDSILTQSSLPVLSGSTYTLSAYVMAGTATEALLSIQWYQLVSGSLVTIGSPVLSSSPSGLNTTTYVRTALSATAPAGASFAAISLLTQPASPTLTAYYDAVQFELGSNETPYTDGTTSWVSAADTVGPLDYNLGLTTNGKVGAIQINWNNPGPASTFSNLPTGSTSSEALIQYAGGVFEVWRCATNTPASAVKIGETLANINGSAVTYDDTYPNDVVATQYYYWLKARDAYNNLSTCNGNGFLNAGASSTATSILANTDYFPDGNVTKKVYATTGVVKVIVSALGASATLGTSGCNLSGTTVTHNYGPQTSALTGNAGSYNVVVMDSTTMTIDSASGFDLLNNVTDATNMATLLNGLPAQQKIVFIYTDGEPQTNRLAGGLPAAMVRCGASSLFSSSNFEFQSAYILVGVPGSGQGNGIELYVGSIASDPNAQTEASLLVVDGKVQGLSGSDPGGVLAGGIATNQETAASAAAAAAAAQTSANSANSLLATISSTGILTPGEKASIIADYNSLIAAQSANDTQAAAVGISHTAYDSALSALTTYLATLTSPVLWSDTSNYTTIVESTFSSTFEAAYSAQDALLNAIAAAINTAAGNAQTAANNAQAAANAAQTLLNTISATSVLTPGEKASIIADYNSLISAQSANDTQAAAVGVSATAYDSALSSLTTYLATLTSPVLWNNASNYTTIVGTTFSSTFEAAYSAQDTLLNNIAAAINTSAGTAQTAANNAQASANAANSLLSTISSTSILTPGEKASIIADYNTLINAQATNTSQAEAVGVSPTAYTVALSNLTAYLATLTSPVLWSDTSNYTSIVGATFSSTFEAAYTAQDNLLNAISNVLSSASVTGTPVNLVPDSNLQFGWTYWTNPGADWEIVQAVVTSNPNPASPVPGCQSFLVSSAASGASQWTESSTIQLVAGQTYTLSAFIDSYYVTAGGPQWVILNLAQTAQYANIVQTPGHTGRISATFTFSPSGITAGTAVSVALLFDTSGATITAGGAILASAPMIQPGNTMTAYIAGVASLNSTAGLAHGAMSSAVQSAVSSSGNVSNLGGVTATSITPIANLMPSQAGADVTAQQAIVYTGSSQSIVPNGTFVLGTTQGWALNGTAFDTAGAPGTYNYNALLINASALGANYANSPAFSVVAGGTYRVTVTGFVDTSGVPDPVLRVNYGATASATIGWSASNYTQFTLPFVLDSEASYTFDWTAPAGAIYAALLIAPTGGTGTVWCEGVTCTPYGAAAQWGADVTGANTSAGSLGLGSSSASHVVVVGTTGSMTLYDGSGNPTGVNPTKRHMGTTLFSQTNGALANDGETIYFNSASGTPYLQDVGGNPFPSFSVAPTVALYSVNPPSNLGQMYPINITPTSFVLAAKTNAQNFAYSVALTNGANITLGTASATALDTATDAYNTAAVEASGTTTQVSFTVNVKTTSNLADINGKPLGPPLYSGGASFVVQVWSGNMGTLVQSATLNINWSSTGSTYSASAALPVSIAANTAYTVRVYTTNTTAQAGISSFAAAVTGTYSAAVSVNGTDFLALLVERW